MTDDGLTPTSQSKRLTAQQAFVKNMKAVVRAPVRKLLRMITVMRVVNKLKSRKTKVTRPASDEANLAPKEERLVRIETPTHAWGKIPVASWDADLSDPRIKAAVAAQTSVAEPGARSEYDREYDEGKSKHNPRSEFAAGNGLPESLKDSFNAVARGEVPRGLQRSGFGGKGKGKGFFGGKGRSFGGKGKGKGFRKPSWAKGKGFGKGSRNTA
jgi:hypothetical protein